MQQHTDIQLDRLARRRARAKLGFFFHASVYVAVNFGLIALSLYNSRAWAIFPLLGWGIGLLFHGLSVWVFAPGSDLMERIVRRERAKLPASSRGEPW